jgi:hypothetical protein
VPPGTESRGAERVVPRGWQGLRACRSGPRNGLLDGVSAGPCHPQAWGPGLRSRAKPWGSLKMRARVVAEAPAATPIFSRG